MSEYSVSAGLDGHEDTCAVALPKRGKPVYRGEIVHRRVS